MRSNMKGASRLTILVFCGIFVALLYVAYNIIPIFYSYYELQNQFDQLAKVASTMTDRELQSKIRSYLRQTNVPAEVGDVAVTRVGDDISLKLDYQEDFYITFRDKEYVLHTFDFHINSKGSKQD